jgi:YidC/Oxa1 family membrane protein insertase
MGDVGIAIILLTIIVKFILFPLSKKSIKSQIVMKELTPLLKKIKVDYPNKEEQAKRTFALYKEYKINPFSGLLLILIQLPVILALYYVFWKGLSLEAGPLYSFLQTPTTLNTVFLGQIDIHGHSIVLAVLAGVTQFIQGYFASPIKKKDPATSGEKATFQDQLSDSMAMNIKYILPLFIGFISYKLSAGVALYWVTSNVFTILQEMYVRKIMAKSSDSIRTLEAKPVN